MRFGKMLHRNAQTYLVHLFGRGLDDERYVIERYRSPRQRRDPSRPGRAAEHERPAQAAAHNRDRERGEEDAARARRDHHLHRAQSQGIRRATVGLPGNRPAGRPPRALTGDVDMPRQHPAKQRARLRRRHAERIARGLCTRCGKAPPEPGLKVCGNCGGKRRAVDRARRARARQKGRPYGGRDPDLRRRSDRAVDKRRRQAWREAGLCTKCGRNPPAHGGSVCDPCGEARRATARKRYAARRSACLCTRCALPAIGGSSRCGRCAAIETDRASPKRRSAVGKKRYARRRARGLCTDCGVPTAGTARCARCAYRSNTRAPAYHGAPAGPPFYTVIELETGEDHGTFETEAEVAACLAFAGLRPDQVEIRANVPLLALSLTAVP